MRVQVQVRQVPVPGASAGPVSVPDTNAGAGRLART